MKKKFKERKDLMINEKNRIMEKTHRRSKSFSKAVVSGWRYGSGKLVFRYYESWTKTISYKSGIKTISARRVSLTCRNSPLSYKQPLRYFRECIQLSIQWTRALW